MAKLPKYYVVVTVKGEGFHCDLQVTAMKDLKSAERAAEMYLRDGYRHPEPEGWIYYPIHIIQQIAIRCKP